MCFQVGGTQYTKDMCFQGGRTHNTRDVSFQGGEQVSQGICVF